MGRPMHMNIYLHVFVHVYMYVCVFMYFHQLYEHVFYIILNLYLLPHWMIINLSF